MIRRLSASLAKPLKKLNRKRIPPLKHLPEEIDSDDSTISQNQVEMLVELGKSYLLYKVEFDKIDRKLYPHMESVFKRLAKLDERKA